jgi:MFS transporter, DHA1 family, multidrug resistance protein
LGAYGTIFVHRQALGAMVTSGMAFAGMFAYISGSPFVYIEVFGVAPEHYGYLFAVNVIGLMLGAWLNSRWVVDVGVESMLTLGTRIAALAGCCLFVFAWIGGGGLLGIIRYLSTSPRST